MTRRQLADETALSWGCISEAITYLSENGLVCEEKVPSPQGTGRIPYLLKLNPNKLFLGIDVNEMGLKGCTVDLSGEVKERFEGTLSGTTAEALLSSLIQWIHSILQGPRDILALGLAMQGIYRKADDTWLFPMGEGRIALPVRSYLKENFSLPFFLEHDPNCALFGELTAKDSTCKLLLRLERGIGVALCQGNQIFDAGSLELGETVVNRNGLRLREALRMREWEERLNASDYSFFQQAGRDLGVALGNLCHFLFIDEILLSGSMTQYAPHFLPALRESFTQTYSHPSVSLRLTVTDPALGAARWATEQYVY